MQVPETTDLSHYIFSVWNDSYNSKYINLPNEDDVTEAQSMVWDKEATKEAKECVPPSIKEDFPIPLKEMKIPFGKFFVFDAKEFLHAGGPGKSFMILTS